MQLLDWIIVACPVALIVAIGLYTQSYVKSVADFMSAGRVAKRYLLAVGRGEVGAGAVVFVGTFEQINHAGFSYVWWSWLPQPILLVVGIFGFVIYRYRETRAMTLGQFYEIRYSRNLRLFAGFLGFFAGLLNFGIIPVIGARAMVYFLELPVELHPWGLVIPTYIVLMAIFLSINLFVVLSGGLITIMMANCVEGIVAQLLYLVLIFGLIFMFPWSQISHTLAAQPEGHSYINPLDSFSTQDFNLWSVLMGVAAVIYGTMAWQNQSAYNSAPLTAHEGVMGNLLGRWRALGLLSVVTLLAICAMTYLHESVYADGAAQVHAEMAKIANEQTREQMEIPIALTHLLPTGLKGVLCAILLLGVFGGDSTHLHSWGGLFIQDIVMPLRKKPLTPEQHIRLLRWAMVGVAVFVFFFGIFFPLTGYISMWWSVTMGVYVSGAGAMIIGGLYWKKGTTEGAWAAILLGSGLSLTGIAAQQHYGNAFPLNGLQISFFTMLITLATYVIVSLLTCRRDFDLERMLHRGAYATVTGQVGDKVEKPGKRALSWGRVIGFDENFSLGDKWIAGGLFGWVMLLFMISLVGTIWNLIDPWSPAVWSGFWHVAGILIPIVISVVTGLWFTWGGVRDTIDLFRRLRLRKENPLDDGRVIDHQNLDENVAVKTIHR